MRKVVKMKTNVLTILVGSANVKVESRAEIVKNVWMDILDMGRILEMDVKVRFDAKLLKNPGYFRITVVCVRESTKQERKDVSFILTIFPKNIWNK